MKSTTYSGIKSINGNDFYYEYMKHPSAGSTIIMLHGFLSSAFSFRKLIPYLQDDYNILTVDIPPFGKSGKSKRFLYSYQNMASSILELTDRLQIHNMILAGHSMGGQIVMNMLLQRPNAASSALLLCSSAYLPKSHLSLVYTSYIPFFSLYVKRHLAKSGLEKNLKNVVYNQAMIDEDMRNGYMSPFLNNAIFHGLTRMIRHREGDLTEKDISRIQTPCLLIWGEHDRVVPLSKGKRLHKNLPNSKLVVLKETGHLVPEERPEEIVKEMKEFISVVKV